MVRKIILLIALIVLTFSELKAGTVFFGEKIRPISGLELLKNLRNEQSNLKAGDKLTILLNSTGGSVNTGFAIIRYIKRLQEKGIFVEMVVPDFCASMCFTILQTADKRYMTSNAMLMQHMPRFSNNKIVMTDNLKKQIIDTKNKLSTIELYKINLSLKEWNKLTSVDYYMTPERALEINAIDDIVEFDLKLIKH